MPKNPPPIEGLNLQPRDENTPEPRRFGKTASVVVNGQNIQINISMMKFVSALGESVELQVDHTKYFAGRGAYGTVTEEVTPSGDHFAVKRFNNTPQELETNQTLKDLDYSLRCDCAYIIKSYCALQNASELCVVMELMTTSFAKLAKSVKKQSSRFTEPVLLFTTYCVSMGLEHLHSKNILHRDVKPSNMLVNREGRIKICDFGIAGYLENSLASTNVGTSLYIAPERMIPQPEQEFGIKSDVWSLGISLVELANLEHPFAGLGDFDLVNRIKDTTCRPPSLEEGAPYSLEFKAMVDNCLLTESDKRCTYVDILSLPLMKLNLDDHECKMATFVAAHLRPGDESADTL